MPHKGNKVKGSKTMPLSATNYNLVQSICFIVILFKHDSNNSCNGLTLQYNATPMMIQEIRMYIHWSHNLIIVLYYLTELAYYWFNYGFF